jgi:hypothetical protein
MEVEIIFSGLCVFNNVRNKPELDHEPSVTLIRTDVVQEESGVSENPLFLEQSDAVLQALDSRTNRRRADIDRSRFDEAILGVTLDSDGGVRKREAGVASVGEVHVPYLAFDVTTTDVNDARGFVPVPGAENESLMLHLNGVEIVVPANGGVPQVDETYALVAKRFDYWPESRDLPWNRDLIPERGKQPKKIAAAGFMRLGSGRLAAGRLSPNAWRFDRPGGAPLIGVFALEVVYSDFAHDGDSIVLELRDIESRALIRDPLRFTAKKNQSRITLHIGNNDPEDVDIAVLGLPTVSMGTTNHFLSLNRVVIGPRGVVPTVIQRRLRPLDRGVGSLSSGPCGPTGSNGG